MAEHNVYMEAFERLCADVNTDTKSAIEELLSIADAGSQSRKFVSSRFQMLADKILESRLH